MTTIYALNIYDLHLRNERKLKYGTINFFYGTNDDLRRVDANTFFQQGSEYKRKKSFVIDRSRPIFPHALVFFPCISVDFLRHREKFLGHRPTSIILDHKWSRSVVGCIVVILNVYSASYVRAGLMKRSVHSGKCDMWCQHSVIDSWTTPLPDPFDLCSSCDLCLKWHSQS